jgi:branched-chain amino acid transport system substrate-binding protein
MAREWIGDLITKLHSGTISRREFAQRAGALGLSATLIGQALRAAPGAAAQDATPGAEGAASMEAIGVPGAEHSTDTSKGIIKLYSSWPLTGASEQIGGDAVEAIKLGLADFGNAAGGFALEYEALDDGIAANNGAWDAGKEAENANKVINDQDAMVYLATYNSGAAKISIPILNESDPGPMAMISYANTYPGLTKAAQDVTEEGEPDVYYPTGKRNYMRTVPADDIQGSAAGNWAYTKQERRKAYVLHDNQLYGKGVARVFELTFTELGGEVLGFEGFDPNAPDYQALMTSIADKEPDILYLGAIVNLNASKLLQDMRSVMGPEVMFLGPDGLINQAFVDGAGEAAEGAYMTFAGFPPDALTGAGADYATRMTEILGHSPDAYAVYAYECTVVVIQAIDRVGEKDRLKILDSMFGTEGFQSLLGGTWSFTETGDTDSTTMSVNIVKDGKIEFLEDIGAV